MAYYLEIKNSAYTFPLIFKRETKEEIDELLTQFPGKPYKIIC